MEGRVELHFSRETAVQAMCISYCAPHLRWNGLLATVALRVADDRSPTGEGGRIVRKDDVVAVHENSAQPSATVGCHLLQFASEGGGWEEKEEFS